MNTGGCHCGMDGEPHFPLRRTTPRSTHATQYTRAGRAGGLLYLEPVVEAELMESAELFRDDFTRSYDERSVWTWATYEAPPVLNLNLRGLFSRTDLMSLAAAGAEPDDIVDFVWYGREDRLV